MPPPVSYIDITPLPFSTTVTQAAFNVANEQWFRLVIASESVAAFYTASFTPRYDIYESDGTTLVRTQNIAQNKSWGYPLDAGTYYVKVTKFGGGAASEDFTFSADTRLIGIDVPQDALIINEDRGTNPAIVVSMDGTVLGYVWIPSSEMGAMLPTGESLWHDRFGVLGDTGTLSLHDQDGDYILSTVEVFNESSPPSISASSQHFYVLSPRDTDAKVYRVTKEGVVTHVATLPTVRATAAGVSYDGTVLYWVDSYDFHTALDPGDPIIKCWDLENDVALPDFYTVGFGSDVGGIAVTANFWPGELLALPDGSLVTYWQNDKYPATSESTLLHIDADGALLAAYTYVATSRTINHISRAPGGGSEAINIWWYEPDTNVGRIATLTLATGVIVESFLTKHAEGLQNMTANDSTLFMPSTSCGMVTMLGLPPEEEDITIAPGTPGPYVWVHVPIRSYS